MLALTIIGAVLEYGGAKLILYLSSPTDRPRCPREAHPRSGVADRPTLPRAARRSAVGPGVPDRPTLPRVARRGAWVSRGGLALCTVLMAAVPRMQSSPSSLWVVVGHIIVSVWSQRRPCAAPLARGAFPPAPRGRGAVIDLTHRLISEVVYEIYTISYNPLVSESNEPSARPTDPVSPMPDRGTTRLGRPHPTDRPCLPSAAPA